MMDKLIKRIGIFVLTIFTMHIFFININVVNVTDAIKNGNKIYLFFYQYWSSFYNINFKLIIIFLLVYYFYSNTLFKNNSINKYSLFISFLLSIISMIGNIYFISDSLYILFISFIQIYKAIIIFIGYIIIYYAIIEKIKRFRFDKIYIKNSFIYRLWNKHPILITFVVILLCWLPYIIVFYPGGSTGDTADSIFQFFHSNSSWSIRSINLISDSIYINKHHSVLFTVLLGLFIKLGLYANSFDFGFFWFIIVQIIVIISVFTYLINYLKKYNTKSWIIVFSIIYFGLSSTIMHYALTAVKDTFSAVFTLLYVIFLYQIIRNSNSWFNKKKRVLILIIIMLLVMMFRNNGLYTILFSFPFLILLDNVNKKKIIEILLLVLVIFFSYNNVMLPNLGVSNGSFKEVLSIPFMQIARTAKYHKNSFSSDDIEKINRILDFETIIFNYNPDISDGVKDLYKKESTKEDNINLVNIWYKYFRKYPLCYIESFIRSTYSYFYPRFVSEDLNITRHYFLEGEFNYINFMPVNKDNFNAILFFKYKSLFTIYFNCVGIIDLLLVFLVLFIIRKKEYKYIIPLLPLLSILLVCLASPVNGCPRYVLAIFFSVPIIIKVFYDVLEKK